MNWKITTGTASNGATAEQATLTHEGREYTALGSVIDHASGRVGAYVTDDPDPKYVKGRRFKVGNFEGKQIGTARKVSEYRVHNGERMVCFRAMIDGREYHGRCVLDWGQFVNFRAVKRKGEV